MMPLYRPFLLPLLDDPQAVAALPADPLAEEAALLGKARDTPGLWRRLAQEAKDAYGLPLLTAAPATGTPLLPEQGLRLRTPARFLVLQEPGGRWFVIEHPEGLHQYDRFAQPDMLPALARPSLFARWLAQATAESGERRGSGPVRPDTGAESVAAFHAFLAGLLEEGDPSDWHLEPQRGGYRSRLRIHGQLTQDVPVDRAKGEWLINSVLGCAGLNGRRPGLPLDGGFSFGLPQRGETPVRVSLVPSLHGYALVARFLPAADAVLEEPGKLGLLPEQARDLAAAFNNREGLWLVAGPTGSGKSTTLHALLRLAVARDEKVLAVEDPVERVLAGVQQLQVGSPPGLTYALAVRAFLRQAPDCVMIGEIRDRETAAIAVQAARTGHRVLSTLHARNTPGVLRRLEDLDQPEQLVMPVCQMLIHQRLVPLLCPHCQRERPVPRGLVDAVADLSLQPPEALPAASGCGRCRHGFSGRTALFSSGPLRADHVAEAQLLAAGWHLLLQRRVSLECLLPLLPARTRRQFALCQP